MQPSMSTSYGGLSGAIDRTMSKSGVKKAPFWDPFAPSRMNSESCSKLAAALGLPEWKMFVGRLFEEDRRPVTVFYVGDHDASEARISGFGWWRKWGSTRASISSRKPVMYRSRRGFGQAQRNREVDAPAVRIRKHCYLIAGGKARSASRLKSGR
jgi:hypothetical protein